MRVESAVRLGLIEAAEERVTAAGNTALRGAKQVLLSGSAGAGVPIRHLSLAAEPGFQDTFVDCLEFTPALP